MKGRLLFCLRMVCLSLAGVALCDSNAVDDETVKDMFLDSANYIHSSGSRAAVARALGCCQYDTNRFCRILKQVARERDDRAAVTVYYIGVYGGTNELSYMYSLVSPTNSNYDVQRAAMESIIRNDTPSAQMMTAARSFICNTNNTNLSDREIVGEKLVQRLLSHGDSSLLSETRMLLEQFASQNYMTCYAADACLYSYFPDYSNSLQRLTYYRDALERGAYRGNGFMLNIMTNELRRLEAVVGNSE